MELKRIVIALGLLITDEELVQLKKRLAESKNSEVRLGDIIGNNIGEYNAVPAEFVLKDKSGWDDFIEIEATSKEDKDGY